MPMKKSDLLRHGAEAMQRSAGILELVDNLADAGIRTFPSFSAGGRLLSLRFGEDPSRTLTQGRLFREIGARPPYRSVTNHDPVLMELEESIRAGRPQPRLLDEAGEVLIGHDRAPDTMSTVLSNNMSEARLGPAVLDGWSTRGREALLEAARQHVDDPDAWEAIDAMPEAHGNAALRWICRGMPAGAAIRRQEARVAEMASARPVAGEGSPAP
ncbi:hypothetical protein [Paracoccus sp. ME4]|uniref:hypothetical protein n=1 Tax=Paracoccus sp. ME4 TaxID=3138066 RepID=UPI00398AA88E